MFDLTKNNAMIGLMDASLGLASRRQALIASNLANVDTPQYRTRDFSFEGALRNALQAQEGQQSPSTSLRVTHAMHLGASPTLSLPPTEDPIRPNYERNDGNDVSLDRENLLLARTQQNYQLSSQFLQSELRRLYTAIREGSK
ncbi:MAG TPA: flagellar basal body rod protein FlgB [Holophagaceae bacterium]|nr:flagellar basal body rod protein FlgB [Holophagaceae bacterium]